ncbi:MAG: peptidylprolyl isomerase [Pseudomonadota bacterium]
MNGEPIFLSDIELEAAAQGLIDPGAPFDAQHPQFDKVLNELVSMRLLAQEAVKRRLHIDPAAQHRLDSARIRILGNILMENVVESEIDEDAIRKMYAEQVRLQQLNDEVRLRHILVETEDEARDVLTKIEAGEDFSALAFEHSKDRTTRVEGGELGYVNPTGLIGPFAAAVGNTAVGDVSEAFESELGWHIVKVEDRRQEAPSTLEEMRPRLMKHMFELELAKTLKRLTGDAAIVKGREAIAAERARIDAEAAELDSTDSGEDAADVQENAATDGAADDGESAVDAASNEAGDANAPQE